MINAYSTSQIIIGTVYKYNVFIYIIYPESKNRKPYCAVIHLSITVDSFDQPFLTSTCLLESLLACFERPLPGGAIRISIVAPSKLLAIYLSSL